MTACAPCVTRCVARAVVALNGLATRMAGLQALKGGTARRAGLQPRHRMGRAVAGSPVSGFALVVALLICGTRTNAGQAPRSDADPRVERLVASISTSHLREMLTTLVSFETRSTLSNPASATRGIGAARQWIFDELRRASPKLQVSFDTYTLKAQGRLTRETELRQVIAVLPGKSPRRIYVTAHYDTLNLPGQTAKIVRPSPLPAGFDASAQPGQDYEVKAPGANDDGSGTVLVMELARRFADSGIEFDATLVFALWSGEEQAEFGSLAHAQRMAAAKTPIDAMFNNDIVGNSHGGNGAFDNGSVRVYSEGPEDSMSRSLARYIQRVGAIYLPAHRVRLMLRQDRFQRGSDHEAFNASGFTAVVFREATENYARQHSADDTLDGVDFDYLTQNVRLNAAAIASLALAPPAPVVVTDRGAPTLARGTSGYDAALTWKASPGAVGYRIYWRDAWGPDWQHQLAVGNVMQYVFPNLSIDDVVMGVAAVGADGHESLVSAYVATARRFSPLQFAQSRLTSVRGLRPCDTARVLRPAGPLRGSRATHDP